MPDKDKSEKKKYVAVNGIDFPKKRVEPGQPIPDNIPPEVLKDLLENGDIRER